MNTTNRLWHVAAALGLGLLAVVLTTFYVTNYKRHVRSGESKVTVLVAAKDIPADTPGAEILAKHLFVQQTVARRSVVPGAIASPDQIRTLIATQPVYAGEQITTRRFGTPAERGVRAQLQGNERAVQLAGDGNQLLAGTLHAGDHVDVVAAWEVPDGGKHIARVVLRNLLVLSAAEPTAKSGAIAGTPGGGPSIQLALTDAESQKLEWIVANGVWRLELRPPSGSADSPGSLETSVSLAASGLRRGVSVNSLLSTP
jgi:Flp pilus assembly protein CpaB